MKRAFAILILILLSGCASWGEKREDKFARCPHVTMLAAAQGYIQPASDVWETRAQILEYDTQCRVSKDNIEMTLTAKIAAERNDDAAKARKMDLPLFVATLQGDGIEYKKSFAAPVAFDEGRKSANTEFPMVLNFAVAKGGSVGDKTLMLGFQLTDEQLDYFAKLREKQIEDAVKNNPLSQPAAGAPN